MKILKKALLLLLSFAICVSCAVAFTACGDDQPAEDGTKEQQTIITEEKWNAALSEANFDNVTVTVSGELEYSWTTEKNKQISVVKIVNDMMQMHVTVNGNVVENKVYTGNAAKEQKDGILAIFFALLEEYNNYEYDAETKAYSLRNAVDTDFYIDSELYKIHMENGVVTFSESGQVLTFVCDYTQTMRGNTTIKTVATFSLSDYGTTVITEQ